MKSPEAWRSKSSEGVSLEMRLDRVAKFLTERGYLARWEMAEDELAGGYLLHKCNCPYGGVSSEHNELCIMDQELINELVGQSCQRILSMANDGPCCTYRIGFDTDK